MRIRTQFAAALAATVLTASTAAAQLLTFDNITGCSTDGAGTAIANGYGGFNWNNFYSAGGVAARNLTGGVGYQNGMVTQPCIALNGFGANSSLSAASPFTFNGGFFTAAFSSGLTLTINGLNSVGTQLFTTTLTLSNTTPTLLNVNWAGLSSVQFNTAQQSQFVFDNFRFNGTPDPNIVPEPATVALMGGGLLALAGGAAVRRRAQG